MILIRLTAARCRFVFAADPADRRPNRRRSLRAASNAFVEAAGFFAPHAHGGAAADARAALRHSLTSMASRSKSSFDAESTTTKIEGAPTGLALYESSDRLDTTDTFLHPDEAKSWDKNAGLKGISC